jgi:uncharacterized protein with FMN-binding domain
MKKLLLTLSLIMVIIVAAGCSSSEDTSSESETVESTEAAASTVDGEVTERPEGELPEGMEGGRPAGTEGELPEGVEGELPEGLEGGRPTGTEGELPEGVEGELPEGSGRIDDHHNSGPSEEFTTSDRITLDGSVEYADGTYTGVGTGFNGDITVNVTISDNEITDIEIVSHSESKGYYEEPVEEIPANIVDSQSTDVDTVSGATRTSEGIISAVEDALSQAAQ